jgi:predicted DNA-binding ribbon-helix-helix protein
MSKKTKHIQLNGGKSTLALEHSYWNLIEYLARKDGYGN